MAGDAQILKSWSFGGCWIRQISPKAAYFKVLNIAIERCIIA
jgi:hypothetical protein